METKAKKTLNNIYPEAIDLLTSQGKFYINLGLERCQSVLKLIENPEKKLKCIHVAGTNGKGSVCAMLSAILTASGYKTGVFTSPHVFEYTERIKINDFEIEQEVFAKIVIEIVELANKNQIHLTEFEIITVAAFKYFADNNVDIAIMETGLGGRLDSTNVIESNLCSIITNIDFDHIERLGDTIEKIAFEKAGIIKSNCPVIINKKNIGLETVKKIADEKNSEIFAVKEAPNFAQQNMALKGTYQQSNLALVMKALEILNKSGFEILQDAIEKGLAKVKHPCRFEYLKKDGQWQNIIIDGAHNPNGTKALRESLENLFPNQKIKFIFGCLKNKNYKEMMENLFNSETFSPEIYFYQFDYPNAATYEELATACKLGSKPFDKYKHDSSILTVICGSFYMIKELLHKIDIK